MKIKEIVTTGCLALLLSSPAIADQGSFSAGVKGGTLGVGAEVDLGLNEMLHLRGGVNYLTFSFDSTISNIDYEMEPEFKNGSLLLDWYPFAGAFRLTGGVFINNNEIDLTGTPRKDTLLQGYTIPAEYSIYESAIDSVRVKGTVEFNTFAPYVGMGWNSNVEKTRGWGVSFELGVLFQGSPTVSTLTATAAPPLNALANTPLVLDALEEEKKAIEDDLENFQYYPVASLMLHYTF